MTRIVPFAGSGFDLDALHRAMLAAFSDYIVPLQPDARAFRAALTSRGFDPGASFIASGEGKIIAFWNVGARKDQRYLIGSGTRIEHRGRGLAARVGQAAIRAAQVAGAESFCLEVIDGNTGAERLYRRLGFEVTRKLDCYRLDHPAPDRSSCRVSDVSTVATTIQRHATWEPTWQNATDTLSGTDVTPLLHERGGAILGTGGLVHQIAASDPAALAEILAAAAATGPLILVNVDAADSALCSLLAELGADRFIVQSEMRLALAGVG